MLSGCQRVSIRCDKYIHCGVTLFVQSGNGGGGGGHSVMERNRSFLPSRARILALTCIAFDCWLCNPRVSTSAGSGPGRPRGMPRKCTGILARVEPYNKCGCTLHIQILCGTAIHDLLASEEVI